MALVQRQRRSRRRKLACTTCLTRSGSQCHTAPEKLPSSRAMPRAPQCRRYQGHSQGRNAAMVEAGGDDAEMRAVVLRIVNTLCSYHIETRCMTARCTTECSAPASAL
jgi:hypothetical protein